MIWVNVEYDFPETYPHIIYVAHKTGLKLNVLTIPTPLNILARKLGNLHHRSRWCGPEGKFISINHFLSNRKDKVISCEGTRWAESRARTNRTFYDPADNSFVGIPTFRPVLDFSDQKVCSYCIESGIPLLSLYRYFERTGCYICCEMPQMERKILKYYYPNLFRKVLSFFKDCTYCKGYMHSYFRKDMERFKRMDKKIKAPYTKPYAFTYKGISDYTGIDTFRIRDDPNYTFEQCLKDSKLEIDCNIVNVPQPEHHKEWVREVGV